MEAGAVLLLLFALSGTSSTLSFYGDSISFVAPRKTKDETFTVTYYHRQNGRSDCQNQNQNQSLSCEAGVCTNIDKSAVLQTDEDGTGQDRWCQSEGRTTVTFPTNRTTFSLRGSGCCWVSNAEGRTNWTTHAELDLGTRSDTHAINRCPVTTTVSSLRVPQNCFTRVRLLAHDPDGDKVRCRFAADATVPANFDLDETECTLKSTGAVQTGVHVFELMLEDHSTKNIVLTYADGTSVIREPSNETVTPLCEVKLQFSMEVLPPIPNCEAGHVQPMFLSRTPSHGDVLHATVGQTFQLFAEAQAHHATIQDFQVSGPQNMTKEFKDGKSGKAEVTLSWTPQRSDLYRFVPVCFTAETKETQSEMRCVVVLVTQSSITQGKATVHCSTNKMTVVLEKASMPNIDENFLKLRDPSCSLTSNGTHIIGTISFSACGTKFEDKGDFIVFKNEINSFEMPYEVIIRRETVQIDFSCEFPKTISISSYYNLKKSDYIFTESSFGSFGYTFEIFRDSNFTNKVEASAYPVQVKLLEMVYMGIQASSQLPNVTLFVESCKATPDDNPDNAISYELIKNGCLEDETVKVHPSDQKSFNFEVQAFKFTGNYEQVYITCSVILCEPGSPFSRCAQGCLKDPSRRRRRGLRMQTDGHYITQGPLQLVGPAAPRAVADQKDVEKKSDTLAAVNNPPFSSDTRSSGGWRFKEVLTSNISTVVFASAFIVSLVLMAVIVRHYNRRRKVEDCNVLIESDSEN
ncbi:uncharacterized protein [Leuresthes tenuis]|uniref:uncharacterized protein n=1 Tax=Leuresthes tenuis TaxID=355514 RepID=UPI003B5117D8